MVKCADCRNHVDKDNKCEVLDAALSFPATVEVVCPRYAVKEEPAPSGEEVKPSGEE